MIDIEKFRVLADHFGLDVVMEQNDLEPSDVIRVLYEAGLIDIDDYFYSEVEDYEEEDL